MPSVNNKSKGFSILELMLAMMIFTIMGLTLYSMMDALTRLQGSSLGLQRYVNEGHNMLDKLATEISLATTEPLFLVDPGNTSVRKSFTPEFVCTERDLPVLFFEGINNDTSVTPNHPDMRAKQNIQQLFYTVIDHNLSITKVTKESTEEDQMLEYLKSMKSGIFWDDILVKERILYMTQNQQIGLYVRKEPEERDNTNKVDGKANVDKNGGLFPIYSPTSDPQFKDLDEEIRKKIVYQPFCPMPIYHIEYLFWGNESRSWSNSNGTENTPIRSWDSRQPESGIHEKGELPRAMKILLTLNYNPEIYDKRKANLESAKDQLITLERVVFFKNYKKPETV